MVVNPTMMRSRHNPRLTRDSSSETGLFQVPTISSSAPDNAPWPEETRGHLSAPSQGEGQRLGPGLQMQAGGHREQEKRSHQPSGLVQRRPDLMHRQSRQCTSAFRGTPCRPCGMLIGLGSGVALGPGDGAGCVALLRRKGQPPSPRRTLNLGRPDCRARPHLRKDGGSCKR